MNSRLWRLMAFAALLLMTGCANLNQMGFGSQTTLLEEYRRVHGWSAAETETGVKERESLHAQAPSGTSRLRLALALGFGKGGAIDTGRALQLLDETARTAATHSYEALFAEVFAGILRARLQSESRASAAEARAGAAEAKASAAETKLNALNRQLEGERERAAELEKKLEALKSIEKSLRKR